MGQEPDAHVPAAHRPHPRQGDRPAARASARPWSTTCASPTAGGRSSPTPRATSSASSCAGPTCPPSCSRAPRLRWRDDDDVRGPVGGRARGRPRLEVLAGTAEPVLAIHGISSHRRLWDWLHAEAPELTLVAPDLRGPRRQRRRHRARRARPPRRRHGRGARRPRPGPRPRRRDVDGWLRRRRPAAPPPRTGRSLYAGRRRLPLVPASGAHARERRDGVRRPARPVGPALGERRGLPRVLLLDRGPLLDPDDPLLLRYLEHDLRDGLVRLSSDALVSDGRDIFFGDVPWEGVDVPVRWTHAEEERAATHAPMYPADAVDRYQRSALRRRPRRASTTPAHHDSAPGARAAAALLRDALA